MPQETLKILHGSFVVAEGTKPDDKLSKSLSSSLGILANNQLDALFHVFIYLFQLSTCFEHHSAHHQEIELY